MKTKLSLAIKREIKEESPGSEIKNNCIPISKDLEEIFPRNINNSTTAITLKYLSFCVQSSRPNISKKKLLPSFP